MSIGTALMPLMALLGGGAAVAALVLCVSRRRKTRERISSWTNPRNDTPQNDEMREKR